MVQEIGFEFEVKAKESIENWDTDWKIKKKCSHMVEIC